MKWKEKESSKYRPAADYGPTLVLGQDYSGAKVDAELICEPEGPMSKRGGWYLYCPVLGLDNRMVSPYWEKGDVAKIKAAEIMFHEAQRLAREVLSLVTGSVAELGRIVSDMEDDVIRLKDERRFWETGGMDDGGPEADDEPVDGPEDLYLGPCPLED